MTAGGPLGFALEGPPQRVHIVGIGGAGMSAIAEVLHALGHRVSGTDRAAGAVISRLVALGIDARVGHGGGAFSVEGDRVVAVIASSAIDEGNPDLVAARSLGIAVHRRHAVLAAIGDARRVLSVSGTHGKTTTSTILAAVLDGAGWDPGFIIGGDVGGTGVASGARWTSSPWFVIEGDESDSTFLAPRRAGAIVTNVEPDHLDHHGTHRGLAAAFEQFVTTTEGPAVICADDPGSAALGRLRAGDDAAPVVSYGIADAAAARISAVRADHRGSEWTVRHRGADRRLRIEHPGMHLVRNATAAWTLAVELGADPAAAALGVGRYRGVGRRFERRGEAGGVTFIDDYAHLPSEVDSVFDALEGAPWRRVVAVFQPHSFTRTQANADGFGRALSRADLVVVTDVYPAREQPIDGVTGRLVSDAVRTQDPRLDVRDAPTLDDVVEALVDELRPGDLCLTMGAGDLTTVPDRVLERLRAR